MKFQTTMSTKNTLMRLCIFVGIGALLACGTDDYEASWDLGDGHAQTQEDDEMLRAGKTRSKKPAAKDGSVGHIDDDQGSSFSACGGGFHNQPPEQHPDLYPVFECLPAMVSEEMDDGGVVTYPNPEADCSDDHLCPDDYICHFMGDGFMPWRCCFISGYAGHPVN